MTRFLRSSIVKLGKNEISFLQKSYSKFYSYTAMNSMRTGYFYEVFANNLNGCWLEIICETINGTHWNFSQTITGRMHNIQRKVIKNI